MTQLSLSEDYSQDPEEILLRDLMHVFWRYKFVTMLFVAAFTAAAYLVATYAAPKLYAATAIIEPVSDKSPDKGGGDAVDTLAKHFSEIASISVDNDPKKIEAIAILQSSELFRRYITRNDLLPILFAEQWDGARRKWKTAAGETPTLWTASEYFGKYVCKVASDPGTGLVSLTIRWKDPILAATWANGLVAMANDMQREAAIARSDRTVAYLTDAAAQTDDAAVKQMMYSMIETELKKVMVAEGNRDFAFKFIDPAVVSEKYARPAKLAWLVTAAASSLSVAVFVVFCLFAWRKQ
jgi:uncharacterized protein involved in exopolysaccharide biosynthesis